MSKNNKLFLTLKDKMQAVRLKPSKQGRLAARVKPFNRALLKKLYPASLH